MWAPITDTRPPPETPYQARARYPDQIKFHFDAPCTSVDLTARTATFGDGDGDGDGGDGAPNAAPAAASASPVRYDLLIGADGTQSTVRDAMQAADAGLTVEIADSGRE